MMSSDFTTFDGGPRFGRPEGAEPAGHSLHQELARDRSRRPAARRFARSGLLRRHGRSGRRADQACSRPQFPGQGHRRQDGRPGQDVPGQGLAGRQHRQPVRLRLRSMPAWRRSTANTSPRASKSWPSPPTSSAPRSRAATARSSRSARASTTSPSRSSPRSSCKGPDIHPFYKYLTDPKTDPKFAGDITWNFNKFLINRKGEIIARFKTDDKPESAKVVKAIEAALEESK